MYKQQQIDKQHIHNSLCDVDTLIILETNKDIQQLERDMHEISQISSDLSCMIFEQGIEVEVANDNIDEAEISVREAVINLEKAEHFAEKVRGIVIDVVTVAGLTGVGALGFLAGPLVGVPTTVGGFLSGITTMTVRRVVVASKE